MTEGYGFLFAFVVGLACGAGLDWFRRALDAWAERQEQITDPEGRRWET